MPKIHLNELLEPRQLPESILQCKHIIKPHNEIIEQPELILTWLSTCNWILLRVLWELVVSSRHGRTLVRLSHTLTTPFVSEAINLHWEHDINIARRTKTLVSYQQEHHPVLKKHSGNFKGSDLKEQSITLQWNNLAWLIKKRLNAPNVYR